MVTVKSSQKNLQRTRKSPPTRVSAATICAYWLAANLGQSPAPQRVPGSRPITGVHENSDLWSSQSLFSLSPLKSSFPTCHSWVILKISAVGRVARASSTRDS